jgi:hypothetical protein
MFGFDVIELGLVAILIIPTVALIIALLLYPIARGTRKITHRLLHHH